MVRILICEGQFLNRSRMLRLLTEVGECDLATSAVECVEHCDAAVQAGQPYDLVTLDLELPDLEAAHVVERIWAMKRSSHQQTKVLLTVARHGPGEDEHVIGLADGQLQKPFEGESVAQTLRELGLSG
ncbi:MAG: response regulator [Planctomycetota bacterium]|jgi:two-component system chemotaxis response regulator CheY